MTMNRWLWYHLMMMSKWSPGDLLLMYVELNTAIYLHRTRKPLTPGDVCTVSVRGTSFLSSVSCIIISVFYFAAINLQLICWWNMTTQKNVQSSCENHLLRVSSPKVQEKHFLIYLKCCPAVQIQIGCNCQPAEMCEISAFTPTQQRRMDFCMWYHSIESFYLKINNFFPEELPLLINVDVAFSKNCCI